MCLLSVLRTKFYKGLNNRLELTYKRYMTTCDYQNYFRVLEYILFDN